MATGRVPTTANSPLTAKGDLFGYSTTQARVAVGNNGETLVADSSTTTGLRYTAGTVQANPVLNSAMQIAQRGTSFSVNASTTAYTLDRWQVATQANQACTISRQATGDTTNLPNIQYALRFQRNSGQTGTGGLGLGQSFESINSIPYAGKTITLSFYARAGANYSPTSSVLTGQLYTGTATDNNILTGFTGGVAVASTAPTLTTTWTRYSVTGTVGATATQLGLYFLMSPTGTASTNDYYEVTGVQIDIGSVALPFRTNGATIQGELAACQRYYYRTTANAADFANGYAESTTLGLTCIPFPTTMRIAVTALEQSGTASDYTIRRQGGSTVTCSAVPIFSRGSQNTCTIQYTVASGLTAGEGFLMRGANANAFLGWSAEL